MAVNCLQHRFLCKKREIIVPDSIMDFNKKLFLLVIIVYTCIQPHFLFLCRAILIFVPVAHIKIIVVLSVLSIVTG